MGSVLVNQIVNQVFYLWYFIPILILITVLKSAWFKGILGEMFVNLLFAIFLPKKIYHVLRNVTLPTENGSTQIDHIVVSKYGVFVVETKNMKGWIFGSPDQHQWTQKIFKHSNKFQNPIYQNYKHLKSIEECFNVNIDALFSVIIFVGDSTFKTDMPENVTHTFGGLHYIKSKSVEKFTDMQAAELVCCIESGRLIRSVKTDRAHVAHVKQIVELKENRELCPKCGASMMIRVAKRGTTAGEKFWGCSTYPRCKTIVKFY